MESFNNSSIEMIEMGGQTSRITERETGIIIGIKKSIAMILNKKFHCVPLSLVNSIAEENSEDKLSVILSNAISAETLEDFKHSWN